MRKREKRGLTKHHRRPKAQNGTDEEDNIIYLPRAEHQAWSTLFKGYQSPIEIARQISERYLDPNWQLIAIRK